MQNSLRFLFLALLLSALAFAAPAWRAFSPAGEKFTCQLPAGKIQDMNNPAAHQWLILEKGKFALQVASIKAAGADSQVNLYLNKFLETAKIKETGRKNITVNGLKGVEVTGTMTPSPAEKVTARTRVFATKDHLYHMAAFIPQNGNKQVADQFLGSFKLK
ncbi:MAG: hypothetical protein J0I12_13995 [Candidatus Eremiobacteraeota bacterium]|nr:hypothetical protein [Candidatus Eremiobacteraeota bacterium]